MERPAPVGGALFIFMFKILISRLCCLWICYLVNYFREHYRAKMICILLYPRFTCEVGAILDSRMVIRNVRTYVTYVRTSRHTSIFSSITWKVFKIFLWNLVCVFLVTNWGSLLRNHNSTFINYGVIPLWIFYTLIFPRQNMKWYFGPCRLVTITTSRHFGSSLPFISNVILDFVCYSDILLSLSIETRYDLKWMLCGPAC